jgi:hypothetical protein
MNFDRLSRSTRDPERIPELLAQSMESLDEHIAETCVDGSQMLCN